MLNQHYLYHPIQDHLISLIHSIKHTLTASPGIPSALSGLHHCFFAILTPDTSSSAPLFPPIHSTRILPGSSFAAADRCSRFGLDMSKKIVVKLDLHDNRDKQKAMKIVSELIGIDELSMNMATQKMTVIGVVDPVDVVSNLRKSWAAASIDWVGPAKEGEKKDDGKKDGADAKKEGEGEKKDGGKDGEKKPAPPTEQQLIAELINQYRAYNPYMNTHYVQSMEEDPNSCAIC